MSEEPDDFGDFDDFGAFGALSAASASSASSEEDVPAIPAFKAFVIPLIKLVKCICETLSINYTCILIDDEEGVVRGVKRLKYFINVNASEAMSDAFLQYRIILIENHCRITAPHQWQSLRLTCDSATSYKNAGVSNCDRGEVEAAMLELEYIFTILSHSNGDIDYNYPEGARRLATKYNIELAEAPPNGEPQQMLPIFIFVEICVKDGDILRNIRDGGGWGHHNDFPALRLLRILWKNDGQVDLARGAYTTEVGGLEAVRDDPMFALLTL